MPTDHHHAPIETIRLTARDKRRVIESMNTASKNNTPMQEHRHLRVDYNVGDIAVTFVHPNGGEASCYVVPRNLSKSGIAFLHGRYVHTDCACVVHLPTRDKKIVRIEGSIVRVRHLKGVVHEVSVVFSQVIELDQFVELTDEESLRHYCERNSEGQQLGRALIVDELEADRKLYSLWLEKIGLGVLAMETVPEARESLKYNADINLILVDAHADNPLAFDFIKEVRKRNANIVIVVVSADADADIEKKSLEYGGNAFLAKPFDMPNLRSLIVDALIENRNGESVGGLLRSTKTDDPDMLPLIEEFVGQLAFMIEELETARTGNDTQVLARLCNQLKGAGGGYGFYPITKAAEEALSQLASDTPDAEEVSVAVDTLISVARSASV